MRKTTWCLLVVAFALTPCLAQADGVDTVWMRRFAQPGYCNDEATAMFVDAAGNVYVTGSSQVVEAGQKDYAIVKYSPTGVQLWAERFSGIGHSIPYAITVDGSGNVYVTGASDSARTYSDILTVKYNAAGVLQWSDRYTSPGDCIDAGRAVCVDGSGNVAVCGVTSSVTTSYDWVVIGYSPDGARRFVTPRTSAGGNPDEANAIVADPQGNYYVAGRLWFPGNVDDAVVTKYNSAGAEQWTASYDGPLSGDGAIAVCRSAAGDLYATGWSAGLQDNADILTMKVSAAGALVWTARYAAPENGSDMGLKITVDDEGNPRVLGRVQVGSGGDYDLVTLGYRADSVEQFANRLGANSCTAGGIVLDKDGHVIISGALAGDMLTVHYNGTSESWRRVENYGSGDGASAVGVDDSNYVYVTGRGNFGANAWDFVTIKYNPNAGIEEDRQSIADSRQLPTVARNVLFLAEASSHKPQASSLLDIAGRAVMSLGPGANDISRLAPGIYFVRQETGGTTDRRKVIIQ